MDVPCIYIIKHAISCEESIKLQNYLDSLAFIQYKTHLWGRDINVPRKQLMLCERDIEYRYNDIKMKTIKWNDEIKNIPKIYLPWIKESFNCALVNLYRNGDDHISPHRDDLRSHSNNAIISVSLGATRIFVLVGIRGSLGLANRGRVPQKG